MRCDNACRIFAAAIGSVVSGHDDDGLKHWDGISSSRVRHHMHGGSNRRHCARDRERIICLTTDVKLGTRSRCGCRGGW